MIPSDHRLSTKYTRGMQHFRKHHLTSPNAPLFLLNLHRRAYLRSIQSPHTCTPLELVPPHDTDLILATGGFYRKGTFLSWLSDSRADGLDLIDLVIDWALAYLDLI